MEYPNQILFVQFPHPGGEHNKKTGEKWLISSPHRRKFVKSFGTYLKNENVDVLKEHQDELYFWCEWEADSDIVNKIDKRNQNNPQYIFKPYYHLPKNFEGHMVTDPFVFGDRFYYSICKQPHYPSLRSLNKGSLILFGSCIDNKFVLDTVFVVKNYHKYTVNNFQELKKINSVFYDTSISPLSYFWQINPSKGCKPVLVKEEPDGCCIPINNDDNESAIDDSSKIFRAYEGVMYPEREDFGGIYSFVPCLSNEENGYQGFVRPVIQHSYITDSLTRGIRNTISSDEEIVNIWEDIQAQVLKQGLSLMTRISQIPEKK